MTYLYQSSLTDYITCGDKATVLFAITAGHSWEEAGKLASKISSQVVSQFVPRLEAAQYPVLKSEVL
jgi:sugar/nucleoside kinase (ribokinase family)